MKVVGVRIQGYRAIQDVTLPLAPLTVLVGMNGAGKSTILEALGYLTSEDGAMERLDDARPVLEWYLAPISPGRLRSLVAACTIGSRTTVDRALNRVQRGLVAYRRADGRSTVALNLFDLVVDEPVHKRHDIVAPLLVEFDSLVEANSWAAEVTMHIRALMDGAADVPPFIDLEVPIEDEVPPPAATSMVASPDDISPALLRSLTQVGETVFAPLLAQDPVVAAAFTDLRQGRLSPLIESGVLEPIRRLLQDATVEQLPAFIRKDGSPRLVVLEGPDSEAGEALALLDQLAGHVRDRGLPLLANVRELLVAFGDTADFHLDAQFIEVPDSEADGFYYSHLGTGYRRWLCGALDEATRLVVRGFTSHPLTIQEARRALKGGRVEWGPPRHPPAPSTSVRLIDEPVESLEPKLHPEVLAWLRARVTAKETLVLSSHHSAILKAARPESTEVIGVRRHQGRVTVTPIGPTLLEGLRKNLDEINLSHEELLFSTRALLIVEGIHDALLVRALYGAELAERGVLVHPVGGSDHVAIEAAFSDTAYELLALPTWVMLDKHMDDKLKPEYHCVAARARRVGSGTAALRKAEVALKGHTLRLLPFEPVDIAFGVSPVAYRDLANRLGLPMPRRFRQMEPKAHYEGWRRIRNSDGAKAHVERLLGLGDGAFTAQLVRDLADTIGAAPRVTPYRSPWLNSTMARFFKELREFRTPDMLERTGAS